MIYNRDIEFTERNLDSKYENRVQRIILSCDMFTTGYSVMLLLFLLPYVVTADQVIAAGFLPLACLIPLAVMPLVYTAVHRFDLLLFGRYHLFMPLSAFLSAVFFVLFFGADAGAGGACLVFFCSVVQILTSIVYRYCSFSVRARLVGDSVYKPSIASCAFALFGAAAAVGVVYGFYAYDPETALLNGAYVLASVCVILALVQYLTSFYNIPKLGGRRVQSVKSVFRTFFGGLKKRTYFSSLFYVAAFATLAVIETLLCYTSEVSSPSTLALTVAAVTCAVFFVIGFVCAEFMKRRTWLPSVINLVCVLAASALFMASALAGMQENLITACTVIAAALIGGGGAVALRQMRLRFLTIKSRVTSGTVFVLYELTLHAAVAIAVAVGVASAAVLTLMHDAYAFTYAAAAAVVFAIVGFAVSTKRVARAEDVGELSYELKESDAVRFGAGDIPSTAERDGEQ